MEMDYPWACHVCTFQHNDEHQYQLTECEICTSTRLVGQPLTVVDLGKDAHQANEGAVPACDKDAQPPACDKDAQPPDCDKDAQPPAGDEDTFHVVDLSGSAIDVHYQFLPGQTVRELKERLQAKYGVSVADAELMVPDREDPLKDAEVVEACVEPDTMVHVVIGTSTEDILKKKLKELLPVGCGYYYTR
jgi:hypothetical protein